MNNKKTAMKMLVCSIDNITMIMWSVEGKEEDVLPKPDWKPPPVIPKEANKTGCNKKTFFVCNERKCLYITFVCLLTATIAIGEWTKLPSVTPAHITHARQIRKLFTGRLSSPVS